MKPCKITVDLYNTFRERMPEYVQYDRNVPLEITVLENGKPADLNGLFGRLLVSKPDGHEVYSNDVEINGNVITTILGEQIFTASGVAQVTVDILDEQNSKRALIPFGMRIRSAVITDESIKSSNDYQTITALISDIRALDAMFHVEQEQRAEAFEQSEADREQRFETQMTEWAQTFEQAEATRQFNEERRQSAESKRESAEKARESAERQRVDTEAVRQRQEQERGQGEAGRATAEANRVKAEQTRVDNESSRESAESSRVNAESQRATAEIHRVTAETSRANAESQRATAETNRAGAEGRRSEAESNRVTAESNRATAESKRVTAENTRETQENARREAEEDRATRMAQWEAKAEEMAQKAQEAVDSAQAFVNTNEAKLLGPNDKKDYMGNSHESVKEAMDSNVDWLLGEINTVHYDGQHITATDTIEGRSKSAILKGNTLVNLAITKEEFSNIQWNANDETGVVKFSFNPFKTPPKKGVYTIKLLNPPTHFTQWCSTTLFGWVSEKSVMFEISSDRTETDNKGNFFLKSTQGFTKEELDKIGIIILEGDYTNVDIPYFEGMQSVKMPVLCTTGKNLLDVNGLKQENAYIDNTDGNIKSSNGHIAFLDYIAIPNNGNILFFNNSAYSGVYLKLAFYDINKTYISGVTLNTGDIKASIPSNAKYCRVSAFNHANGFDLQLEVGDVKTSYEPFKSNILSTSEDVVLRKVGDVQDTLDCLTGEVTERVGEIVLDGSEEWKISGSTRPNHLRLYCFQPRFKQYQNVINNRFADNGNIQGKDIEGVYMTNTIDIQVEHSRLSDVSVDAFKIWLSENPITIQARLSEKSIKTVDLSDNHVYSYKGTTHYDCSSAEGSLVPTLSIDVPTNLPAVVARQRATIQELEKENVALKTAVTIVDEHREEGDLELLSSDFDFELRLMEIEFAMGIPMMANYKGVRNMARTPYDMAKALILGGKYEREEMVAKLDRFEKLGSITADQKAELIALMDAVELTQ